MTPTIQYKFTNDEAREIYGGKFPEYGTKEAAGIDLRTCRDVSIFPCDRTVVSTGISLFFKDRLSFGLLCPRSGLGTKQGLVLGNLVGVIDNDYTGEIGACLWASDPNNPVILKKGDKVCQLLILPVFRPNYQCVEEFDGETERGAAGFGSTGK